MKKYLLIGLIILLLPNIAQAQEPNFGISVDCKDGCKDKKIEDLSKDMILEFKIKNNLNYWLSFAESSRYMGSSITVEVVHEKLQEGKTTIRYDNILGRGFLMEPKSEKTIHLPFSYYNNLDETFRMGEWRLTPQFLPHEIKYYPSEFSKKEITFTSANKPIKKADLIGNTLKFEVVKPEVKVEEEGKLSIPELPTEGGWGRWILDNIVGVIIATVAGAGIIYYLYQQQG